MAMISPMLETFPESLSTLRFATRAKHVSNRATVNFDLDKKGLIQKYEAELQRLRDQLVKKSQTVVDKRRLLQLEEEKRIAELDKLNAIRALEVRSREVLAEKMEKKKLEEKIEALQSQLLTGESGQFAEEGHLKAAAYKDALLKERRRLQQYESKIAVMEEGRIKLEKMKDLMLRQRDGLINLIDRLNDRDEKILLLQRKCDRSKENLQIMEDIIDQYKARFIKIQRVLMEFKSNGINDIPLDKISFINIPFEYVQKNGDSREFETKSELRDMISSENPEKEKDADLYYFPLEGDGVISSYMNRYVISDDKRGLLMQDKGVQLQLDNADSLPHSQIVLPRKSKSIVKPSNYTTASAYSQMHESEILIPRSFVPKPSPQTGKVILP